MTKPTMSTGRQEEPSIYDYAEELSTFIGTERAQELLDLMIREYDLLEQDYLTESEKNTRHEREIEQAEITIDDICKTFDMVQTGYRDLSDLARVIRYA
jgi:hypothetical protein